MTDSAAAGVPTDLATRGFEDLVEIGRGGFGVVYRATQTTFRREVALKILPGVDDETGRRFERECQAAGQLSGHPNIVTVYDSGQSDAGRPYLVMEYCAGGTLAARISN